MAIMCELGDLGRGANARHTRARAPVQGSRSAERETGGVSHGAGALFSEVARSNAWRNV